MNLTTARTDFFYSRDFTPAARRWYQQKLTVFVEWCRARGISDLDALTRADVRLYTHEVRGMLSERTGKPLAPRTAHGYLRAVKAFLNWAMNEDLVDARLTRKMDMPKLDVKVMEVFTRRHIDALFRACETSAETPHQAARERAILAVLLDTGVRASELCGLTLERVSFTPDEAFIVVDGKGRKQRLIPLGGKSRQLLHRYVAHFRGKYHPDRDERHVFLAKGGTPLARIGLTKLLLRLEEAAGITDIRCNAHRFRHTHAFLSASQGEDVLTISRRLGHTSLAVTDTYLRAFQAQHTPRGKSVLDTLA